MRHVLLLAYNAITPDIKANVFILPRVKIPQRNVMAQAPAEEPATTQAAASTPTLPSPAAVRRIAIT